MKIPFTHKIPAGAVLLAAALLGAGCSSAPTEEPKPKKPDPGAIPAGNPNFKQEKPARAPKPDVNHPPDDQPGGNGNGNNNNNGGGGVLDQVYNEMTLRDKEKHALADHYFKVGKQFYDQLDYAKAAENFEKAKEADPNDKRAQQYYLMASLLAGDRVAEFQAITQRLREERGATVQQEVVELKRAHDEGIQLLAAHEYDKAIVRFEQVLEKFRWFPYPVTDAGIEKSARENIIKAKKLKRDQEIQERIAREKNAFGQANQIEEANAARRREAIKKRIADGFQLLQTEKYELAEDTFNEVLAIEPGNEQAQKYLSLAEEGRHWKANKEAYDRNKFEGNSEDNNMDEVNVPYLAPNHVVDFPDDNYWREKVQRRGVGIQGGQGAEEPAWITDYKKKLQNQHLTFNFAATPFSEVVQFLQDFTGLNITVSKAIDQDQVKLDLRLRDVVAQNALDIILNQTGFAMSFKNETLMITPKDEAKGEYSLDIYDVQDILSAIPDFPGERIRIRPPKGGAGGAKGGGGAFTFDDDVQDEKGSVLDPDKLEQLVKNSTGADEVWGDPASYELHRGQIIVNQTREIHAKIKLVLENLRRNLGLFVQVETRFILIHNDYLEEFGIDYRGLGTSDQGANPPLPIWGSEVNMDPNIPGDSSGTRGGDDVGFFRQIKSSTIGKILGPVFNGIPFFGSNAIGGRIQNILDGGDAFFSGTRLNGPTVTSANGFKGFVYQATFLDPFQVNVIVTGDEEKLKEKIVTAPVVVAANRQRVHVSVVTQRAYIADYELSSGGTGLAIAEVASPIVQTLQEGIVLDVKPTISADRKYVTLDLRPALAELQGGTFTEIPVNLGTISNAAINVNIEVPTVSLREAYTSVTVPDGGTCLVGGFRQVNEKEQRSGLPFLDDAPFLNLLFRKEAELRETESLIILVTARIVALREEEKKHFNHEVLPQRQ